MKSLLGRIGRMAYINTLPIDWGFVGYGLDKTVELIPGTPTELNRMLSTGKLDASIVSTFAMLENMDDWLVFDNLCISCKGAVGSVFLVSEIDISQLDGKSIAVTSQSASSVKLLEILLTHHWHIKAKLVPEDKHCPAKLVIGDEALALAHRQSPKYFYDLGDIWYQMTGLGFVFAVFCIRREFAIENSDKAKAIYHLMALSRKIGRLELDKAAQKGAEMMNLSHQVIRKYFFDGLIHDLDNNLISGLERYAQYLDFDPVKIVFFK